MGCQLSYTIVAASLGVVTPRVQTINNGPMATCTGHSTAGGFIKFRDNRWLIKWRKGERGVCVPNCSKAPTEAWTSDEILKDSSLSAAVAANWWGGRSVIDPRIWK
ncbi:hypothetical protein TNCV_4068061 [Trichonephila clavipes]|nr:hypothetical protein TNCV_4068061 [Trichonephila clavipes]